MRNDAWPRRLILVLTVLAATTTVEIRAETPGQPVELERVR